MIIRTSRRGLTLKIAAAFFFESPNVQRATGGSAQWRKISQDIKSHGMASSSPTSSSSFSSSSFSHHLDLKRWCNREKICKLCRKLRLLLDSLMYVLIIMAVTVCTHLSGPHGSAITDGITQWSVSSSFQGLHVSSNFLQHSFPSGSWCLISFSLKCYWSGDETDSDSSVLDSKKEIILPDCFLLHAVHTILHLGSLRWYNSARV